VLTAAQMTWLHNTTTDPGAAPLLAEIARLQRELDRANESVDDKLDRLEDAGHGAVGLTRQLADARARAAALEEERARLERREARRTKRLARARCGKCRTKVDLRALEGDDQRFARPWMPRGRQAADEDAARWTCRARSRTSRRRRRRGRARRSARTSARSTPSSSACRTSGRPSGASYSARTRRRPGAPRAGPPCVIPPLNGHPAAC
jgi:hypothetical protein